MMTVADISRRSGVTPHAVRYYSRLGLLVPGRHPDNGYRQYDQQDVARLRFIRQAQSLGFSLEEIADILRESGQGKSPCPRVRAILSGRIEENRRRLAELQDLQRRMEQALAHWACMPDGMPDGHSVCHLIESEPADG